MCLQSYLAVSIGCDNTSSYQDIAGVEDGRLSWCPKRLLQNGSDRLLRNAGAAIG